MNVALGFAPVVMVAPGAPGGAAEAPKLDPMQLVLHASLPVKCVIAILVLFSVACWIVILAKSMHLARARRESAAFLKAFDKAASLERLAQQGMREFEGSPYARIFAAGYDEVARLRRGSLEASAARPTSVNETDQTRRLHSGANPNLNLNEAQSVHVESLTRRAATAEIAHLESWMSLLGTTGSTAPFIGLFGTVYGIMDAFLSIGNQQSANLPVVAPKIAEALIATAIGLVAAIPSVMAFNYFGRRVGELADAMEAFALDVAARLTLGGS